MIQNSAQLAIEAQTISQLFDASASTEPTPGGGCVSAVGGYLGIALLLKAMRISARKQAGEILYSIEEDKLSRLATRLLRLAESDSNSFGSFIAALQMPKGTEDEKSSRRQAMQSATVEATRVAIEILHSSNEMLQSARIIRTKVLKSILADVRAGAEFAATMAAVARANADTNLAGLAAGATRDGLQRVVEKAQQLNESLLNECRNLNEAHAG